VTSPTIAPPPRSLPARLLACSIYISRCEGKLGAIQRSWATAARKMKRQSGVGDLGRSSRGQMGRELRVSFCFILLFPFRYPVPPAPFTSTSYLIFDPSIYPSTSHLLICPPCKCRNAHYPPHSHSGLTTHLVRRGTLTITYPRDENPSKETFGVGARIDVPVGRLHEVWMGGKGCEYVIGE
jgi:hypothetical protein